MLYLYIMSTKSNRFAIFQHNKLLLLEKTYASPLICIIQETRKTREGTKSYVNFYTTSSMTSKLCGDKLLSSPE